MDEPTVVGARLPPYLDALHPWPRPASSASPLPARKHTHMHTHACTHACTDEHTGADPPHTSPYAHSCMSKRTCVCVCMHISHVFLCIHMCEHIQTVVCVRSHMRAHVSHTHVLARVHPDHSKTLSCSPPVFPTWAPPSLPPQLLPLPFSWVSMAGHLSDPFLTPVLQGSGLATF